MTEQCSGKRPFPALGIRYLFKTASFQAKQNEARRRMIALHQTNTQPTIDVEDAVVGITVGGEEHGGMSYVARVTVSP